ncbi:MAG TPA: WbqC family protein [Flavobacteriaceae bacterium]|nr:WbqC family protein [Flavobacteriaceae bacterium]
MTNILLHPAYFGPIDQFVAFAKADEVIFENEDNYQKQTYRNRQYIYGANGKLLLNIPVQHAHNDGEHQLYKEVKIENNFHWQRDHWRSLQTAYRTSPFFEYYEDDFAPLYEQKQVYLLDFNYHCLEVVLAALSLDISFSKTTEYMEHPENCTDLRNLIVSKREHPKNQTRYAQVFEEKHGFLKNLSVLDLIFNEGPAALEHLKNEG